MFPYWLDVLLRAGRVLGTFRSLVVQTKDLLDLLEINGTVEELVDVGLEM